MYFNLKYSFIIIVLLYITDICNTQNIDNSAITISLKNYNGNQPTQVFSTKNILNSGATSDIIIKDLKRSIKFFIVQVHSFETNTLLSNTTNFTKKTTVNGTNNGLVQQTTNLLQYKFYVRNENYKNVTVLVVVVPYSDNVPIPGGCNMEFMVETAPYQKINYTNDVVLVDAQSASLDGEICDNYVLSYSMYHLYMTERDFSEDNYFETILKMLTPEDIERYGTEVHKIIPSRQLRRIYSAYPGTGAVYGIVVRFLNERAAYVPIATYACDVSNDPDIFNIPNVDILCGVMIFVGLFTCLWGHRFFRTFLIISGVMLGSFFSYMGLYYCHAIEDKYLLVTSLSIGIFVGILWQLFWWFFGIPILSILFSLFALGFTCAAVLFYAALGDINILESDLNYWGLVVFITLLLMTILIGFTHRANILAGAILGSCGVIMAIDHYIGSNLKYIFINVIRRATVDNFEYAILSPPFQYRDAVLSSLWIVLALLGLFSQLRLQKGHPPFPPHRCTSRRRHGAPSERTPLLGNHVPFDVENTIVPSAPLLVY